MDIIYCDPEDERVERPDWLPEDWYVMERYDGDFGVEFIGFIGPTCGVTPTKVEGEWSIYKAANYTFAKAPTKRVIVQTPQAAVAAALLLYP